MSSALALPASAAAAEDLRLSLPLDCRLGETCFIQHLVDADPGPGARDHTGGDLTYDGHGGTDFRVPDLETMEAGVPVLAPAPGVVRNIRDGMADRSVSDVSEVADRECGNGVAIDHGDGWETQLCHLARGSIAVAPGETVARGQVLGRIGLSGATQFPHVHLAVRRNGVTVDPFPAGLWQDMPDYRPGGFLSAGFADAVPDFDDVKAGTADAARLPVTAPALVIWASLFGGRPGDVLQMTIIGPDGGTVFTSEATLDRAQAELFRAAGRRLSAPEWRGGTYSGTVVLIRKGTEIDRIATSVWLD
ncbi:M23 family metallopeptidase [Jannaschia rubra]|uniref:Putative peptidase n=1 Tax=Jannaschia rubra TaxID=282197 RepID=A0A0M6XKL1_9RHOB|nr:M23 family metallopeptidase [Jannaschia rubra]CTQ31468.1 putative peptidase [Jannaschia rubra]SFF78846.1 Peptidase family M23 [Jannaschia rubra]